MESSATPASGSAVPENAFRAHDRLYKCVKAANGKFIQATDFTGVLDVRACMFGSGSARPDPSSDAPPSDALAARVVPVAERRADGSWTVSAAPGFDAGWTYEAPGSTNAAPPHSGNASDVSGRLGHGAAPRKGPAAPPLPSRAFDASASGGAATRIFAIRNAPGLFIVSRALTHAQQFLWAMRSLTQYADADYTNLSNLHGADRDRVSELFWRCCRENVDAAAAAAAKAPSVSAENSGVRAGGARPVQQSGAARAGRGVAVAPQPAGAEVKRQRILAHLDAAGNLEEGGSAELEADAALAQPAPASLLSSPAPALLPGLPPRALLPRPCPCAPSPLGVASLAEYLNWGTATGAPGAYRPCLPTDCERQRLGVRARPTASDGSSECPAAGADAGTSSTTGEVANVDGAAADADGAAGVGDEDESGDVGCACGPGGCGRVNCHATAHDSEPTAACCADPWCVTQAHPGLQTAASVRVRNFSRLAPLRWASLGYRYDWTAREYGENAVASLPPELITVTQEVLGPLVQAGLVPQSTPEAALVNFYPLSSSMGAHIDDAEPAVRRPIVSFSLGSSAVFLVGSASRAAAPLALLLHSGDAIIQAGPARRAFHAVPRIIERSCPVRALHAAAARLLRAAAAADENGHVVSCSEYASVSVDDVSEFRGLIQQCEPQMRANGMTAETVADFVICTLGEYRLNFNTRQVADEGAMLPSEVRKHFPVNAVIGGVYAVEK